MKRKLWIGVAFLILGVFGFVLNIEGLSQDAMWVLGIFASALVLWMTQGIEWPTVFVLLALGLVPTLGMGFVVQSAFGNAVFAFLLFSFMSTYALSTTPLMKNIAYYTMSLKISRKNPQILLVLLLSSVLLIGLFVSPTVLFFVVYPIFEEILNVLEIKKGSAFGSALMIGSVMVLSLSSGMTPIGHVFPVLALSVYESMTATAISYGDYMLFAIPVGLIMFALLSFVLIRMFNFKNIDVSQLEHQPLIKMEKKDWLIVGIFSLMIILWVFPSIFQGIFPAASAFINKLQTAFPALLGVFLMSFITLDNKPLLKISEALTKGVPWISLIMAGSTLAIGAALTHGDIGIMTALQNGLGPMLSGWPPLAFISVFVVWALFQSNVSSHMVTAQVVSAVAVPIALVTTGLDAKAMVMVIGLLASVGSSTPSSMPYVAIVGSSGWSNPKEILRVGLIVTVLMALCAIFIGYPFASWI